MALPHAITASSCVAAQSRRLLARRVLGSAATAATAVTNSSSRSTSGSRSREGFGGNDSRIGRLGLGRRFISSHSATSMAWAATAATGATTTAVLRPLGFRLVHPADRVPRRCMATGTPDANRAQPDGDDHQGPSSSPPSASSSSSPSPSAPTEESSPSNDASEQHHQRQQQQSPRSLPLPADKDTPTTPTTTTLKVGGEGVRLDAMGPLVVNRDGTTGRVANWAEMTEGERATTLALLGRRNRQRLEVLRGEAEAAARDEK